MKNEFEQMDSPVRNGSRSKLGGALRKIATGVVLVVAVLAAFVVGVRVGDSSAGQERPPSSADVSGAVEYWTCSMHPEIRQPGPGHCPICGMELVPVTRTDEAPKVAKAKYACAMMCLPPLDHPGKCPVCGMEMMPVDDGETGDAEAPSSPEAISEISVSPAAQKLARLTTVPVERRFASAEIRMVGKVDFDETRVRTISSRVAGRLDRLYVDYTGVPVRQGDHLVSIYSPQLLAAQQELIQAEKGLQPSSSEDVRSIRQEMLEATRQKLGLWGLTQEQVAEIETRGTASDHLTIYAPIGGIVTEKRLSEGAYVEEGTEIYQIADLSSVWVKLDAYEVDLGWLRYGQAVEFSAEAHPGETFHGTIVFIDPILNDRTRTTKVRVNVPNTDGRLKPGMFVRAIARPQITAEGQVLDPALAGKWICPMHPEVVDARPSECTKCGMPLVPAESLGYASISPAEAEPPLVIPVTAPLITGKRAIVYVATAGRPGRYEGREIVLGPRAGDVYLVRDGLEAGEQVVVEGNLYLDSAVQIRGKQSMMQPESVVAPESRKPAEIVAPTGVDQETSAPPTPDLSESVVGALDAILGAYLATHAGLKDDNLEAAQPGATSLIQSLEHVHDEDLPSALRSEWARLSPRLRDSADAIAAAKSIESARAAFEGLSNAIIATTRHLGSGRRERVYVYHCPMAFNDRGANWLQEKQGVENPYFGAAMFTCGVLKETLHQDMPAHKGSSDE